MAPAQRSELVLLHRAGTGPSPAPARDAEKWSGPDEAPITDPHVLRVALKFREVLEALGLDRSDPNLRGTEFRVARGYLELFAGLKAGNEPVLRAFPNTERYAEPVSALAIPFYSTCAHHFLPFFGRAHIAYLPGERLVGLSKLARVVEFFARRPQLQERMTEQIAGFLDERLAARGTAVVIQARHLCMEMRGVGKPGLTTTTSAFRGAFDDDRLREEFWRLVGTGEGVSRPMPAGTCDAGGA